MVINNPRVPLSLTPEQHKLLRVFAQAEGIPMSYIMQRALDYEFERLKEDDEIMESLREILNAEREVLGGVDSTFGLPKKKPARKKPRKRQG